MPTPQEQNPFYGKDFITVNEIDRPSVDFLFERADRMKAAVAAREVLNILSGHVIAVLFYQPSTRTIFSFITAIKRLGGIVVSAQDMKSTSVEKGENLPDTVRTVQNVATASAIVLRHWDNTSSEIAAKFADIPVINAGSGTAEHPTQALLDIYTIKSRLGRIDNLHIAVVGDLLYGRTVKSLVKLLAEIGENNQFSFVSHPDLALPQSYLDSLPPDLEYNQIEDLGEVLEQADVIYMTRTQEEWFNALGKHEEYELLKDSLRMTAEMADQMKPDSIIMHPLPRQTELRYRVDDDPRAAYFEQMRNGTFIRMALLECILTNPGTN